MASEVHSAFINYYEYLNVAQNAPSPVIQKALDNLVISTQPKLNMPLTMIPALHVVNEIVPAIQRHLLSGDQARAEYDRQLVTDEKKQAGRSELPDDEGLDDSLRQPFFFDPFDGYDTETPARSLRRIALKLDTEWSHAHRWIRDTSDESHVFAGFLTDVAGRPRLAKRIEQIIEAISRTDKSRMGISEGIERCINILNPQIERADVGVYAPNFDGKVLDAGDFVSDLPAQIEITLRHEGIRGCVFGTMESRTSWLTFPRGLSTIHFNLMPEGTDPHICASEVKVPLLFQVSNLARNADHTAELVMRMENRDPIAEIPIRVLIHMRPLPPRVMFEPAASPTVPAWAGTVPRGVPTRVVVIARNAGDERLVPLVARIYTREPGTSVTPERFHANEPVTLTIDTSNRPFGKRYDVVFGVDYGLTGGALGPTTLHVRGDILPTPWQSLEREKNFGERVGIGCVVSFAGFILLGALGAGVAAQTTIGWLFFLAIPILLALVTQPVVGTIVAHIQRSGNANVRVEKISPCLRWGLPAGCGLVLALICALISNQGSPFLVAGMVGCIIGFVLGFVLDRARVSKTGSPTR